ncbi:osmoprotectant transporter permease [Emticicia sp. BO119]|uniref:osmoprotectant transporter permease n=1 Tax=Emticicia sp. BO119 TaxID=2757768 RepID=UPI0015F006CD|nr:osmoprotectant transporter permease [Emticicia sp. BO119]MBA4852987.1 osmoprotectant transporter permease [Emticicia sp. BO119]
MILFWVFWGIDAIVALIAVCFFFTGLADGSVSSFNIGLWLIMLIVIAAVLSGTLALRSAGNLTLAKILAGLLAVPAFLFFLFFIIIICSGAKWN